MPELFSLLKPELPAFQAIQAAYNELTLDEQKAIEARLNVIFIQGFPLELKTEKILYIHLFSLLLQLKVIALQIPMRFGPLMAGKDLQLQMRSQLLDEVFHCMVFAKVLNQLCLPHAYYPEPCLELEAIRLQIAAEQNSSIALVLLNLIGESWTKLLFSTLLKQEIAPELFQVMIEDEKRHFSSALLFSQTQQVDSGLLRQKCHEFEALMLNLIQYHFLVMAEKIFGFDNMQRFIIEFDSCYHQQMNNIDMSPSPNWKKGMKVLNALINQMGSMYKVMKPISMTPLRQAQMVMWSTPSEATMAGQFALDITDIDIFSKKYPPETLTSLLIQTTSLVIAKRPEFRNFLSFEQMYQYQGGALVGIVVKLPNCGDHLGTIVLEDAHLMDIRSLSKHIRDIMEVMVYCFHQCRKLEKAYPELAFYYQDWLKRLRDPFYPYPLPTAHFVSLSNIGMSGLYTGASPLMKNEAVKLTLLRAEKKQVWDAKSANFVIKDILPVCLSADHRVFDANWPMQRFFQESFAEMFTQVKSGSGVKYPDINILKLVQSMTSEIEAYPGLQYQYFSMLQTLWPSFTLSKQNALRLKVLEKLR